MTQMIWFMTMKYNKTIGNITVIHLNFLYPGLIWSFKVYIWTFSIGKPINNFKLVNANFKFTSVFLSVETIFMYFNSTFRSYDIMCFILTYEVGHNYTLYSWLLEKYRQLQSLALLFYKWTSKIHFSEMSTCFS